MVLTLDNGLLGYLFVIVMVTCVFDMFFFSNAELYLLQEVFLNVAAVTWNSLCDVPKQPYEVREGFVEIF